MTGEQIDDMYRLLAIAKYEERYVIPAAHAEDAHRLEQLGTECSLDYEGGPGMGGSGPFGESSGAPAPDRRWRTSTCCATGRPPTPSSTGGQARPGQPAQLGRQGPTRTGCSRRETDGGRA